MLNELLVNAEYYDLSNELISDSFIVRFITKNKFILYLKFRTKKLKRILSKLYKKVENLDFECEHYNKENYKEKCNIFYNFHKLYDDFQKLYIISIRADKLKTEKV